MTLGNRAIILGNNFAMAHELTVRPCEGAVYLPNLSRAKEEHMGQRLPCTICSVTEVWAITEETVAVRVVGPATLAPHTVTQVQVGVPTPRSVMIETGPGPLGLCPVQGVVEVVQDSRIWLANTGPQPIRIEENEVVAMAECVTAGPGASPGDDRNDGNEVNGLVERAATHLTDEECQQLRTAMASHRHLFATGKGDQPAIKQRVRRYPAVRQEEERQLVEDMLAIGIIQEIIQESCGQLWRHTGTCSQQEREISQRLNKEFDATQRPAGRRKGSSLRTCWLSGLSKRATVRGAARPSW